MLIAHPGNPNTMLTADQVRDMAEAAIRNALVGPMTPQREALLTELRAMPDDFFAVNIKCLAQGAAWAQAFAAARKTA